MPSLGLPIYGQQGASPDGQRSSGPDARRWRSVAEAGADPALAPGEFPEGDNAAFPDGLSRRGFLQLLGASAALAGLAACKPPRERVVSYVRPPEAVTPSTPSAYATALARDGYGVGVVVTSWEGRPTKIEGNREHPASRGGSDAILQAAILDLYEQGRLHGQTRDGKALGRVPLLQALAALARSHERDGGARLRFLVEPTTSPTLAELRRRIQARFPAARFHAWSPAGDDAARAGHAVALGRPLDASWALPEADVILALDCDLLATDGEPLRQAREFAARRVPPRLNRLYAAEARMSVTGAAADHRFRMRSAEVLAFGRAVAAELAARHGLAALAPLGAPAPGPHARAAAAVAADLARAAGRSLVAAGRRQPPAVHALAAALNEALGNAGRTVEYRETALLDPDAGPGALADLARALDAGQVETLVVTAWNPLHTAPADLALRERIRKAKDRIVLAYRDDETARAATWRLAASHPLETWGDLRSRDGTVSIVQPLIAPLVESLSEVELLAGFVDQGDLGAWRIVREGWRARTGDAAFDRRWDAWLAAGVVAGSAAAPARAPVDLSRVAEAIRGVGGPGAGLELNLVPDYKLWDGRYAENAWLQELPDPITKSDWDSPVLVSQATAARLGLAEGDVVTLAVGGRSATGPLLVAPGHADDAVTVPLGYGQRAAGAVGSGVGFDAYALRARATPWFAAGLEVKGTGATYKVATTQEHFQMMGRAIALTYDAGELPHAGHALDKHRGPQPNILPTVPTYDEAYKKEEYRWGMAIDLSKCIGCGACTVACQAENNIPVVGRGQVLRSREMHWLRVDRYFEGSVEDPRSVSQPLACVHCEAAPCEYVCPVNATVHSEEGLNQMVYNRCVGTRYCSNNCPYKVRRFNWVDWHADMPERQKLLQNPDVTVRARGVMEKCTYCVQRIERHRIDARVAGRKMGGDEVVSACQQACPAEAIVFGNLNDPGSAVARAHADGRRYDLLHELGTRPRTAYLVKVQNPNPELA